MTVHTMSSEHARNEWRTLLDLASQAGDDVVIERHGKATAAVISYEIYLAIQPILADIRTNASVKQRGQKMATLLEQLAQLPKRAAITDPVLWQTHQRQDRALPGGDSDANR